jgi:hypothetical protein
MAGKRSLFVVVAALVVEGALQAQAPRESAEVAFGPIKVCVEHGCPPWNEARRAQMERQLPVGGLWRIGADDHTTILVSGGAIRLGDLVVDDGGFGLNARRATETDWTFVVYDGGEATASPEDNTWETPATFTERQDPAPERLAITIADEKGTKLLTVRFGPMVLSAPIVPVESRDAELTLGGETANTRWFSAAAANAPRPGAWVRVGTTRSFFVGEVNCALDVDMKLDASGAAVRFRNRARARVADKIAELGAEVARLKKGAAGEGGARAERAVKSLEAQLAKLTEELKDVGSAPEPLELAVPLAAAKSPSGKFGAELVRHGDKLELVVQANDRAGTVAVDEAKLLPPKQ